MSNSVWACPEPELLDVARCLWSYGESDIVDALGTTCKKLKFGMPVHCEGGMESGSTDKLFVSATTVG